MADRTYRTRDGDVLDAICKAELGSEDSGLAQRLPEGVGALQARA